MKKVKKFDPVKVLGIAATVGGIAISLISDFVTERKIDAKIEEKVKQALEAANNKKGD